MKSVYTGSEMETKMMQEILTNAGLKSMIELSINSLHGLKTQLGGGALPGEAWELKVHDSDEEKAKDLLP